MICDWSAQMKPTLGSLPEEGETKGKYSNIAVVSTLHAYKGERAAVERSRDHLCAGDVDAWGVERKYSQAETASL